MPVDVAGHRNVGVQCQPTGLLSLRVFWRPIGGHSVENDWFLLAVHHVANNLEQCSLLRLFSGLIDAPRSGDCDIQGHRGSSGWPIIAWRPLSSRAPQLQVPTVARPRNHLGPGTSSPDPLHRHSLAGSPLAPFRWRASRRSRVLVVSRHPCSIPGDRAGFADRGSQRGATPPVTAADSRADWTQTANSSRSAAPGVRRRRRESRARSRPAP